MADLTEDGLAVARTSRTTCHADATSSSDISLCRSPAQVIDNRPLKPADPARKRPPLTRLDSIRRMQNSATFALLRLIVLCYNKVFTVYDVFPAVFFERLSTKCFTICNGLSQPNLFGSYSYKHDRITSTASSILCPRNLCIVNFAVSPACSVIALNPGSWR